MDSTDSQLELVGGSCIYDNEISLYSRKEIS